MYIRLLILFEGSKQYRTLKFSCLLFSFQCTNVSRTYIQASALGLALMQMKFSRRKVNDQSLEPTQII